MLFVCLGNICRSPLAEGVFRKMVVEAGLGEQLRIDSAGTTDYHEGELPDSRTVQSAARRGVRVEHVARQVRDEDLHSFDYILVMDRSNLRKVRDRAARAHPGADVRLLRSLDPEAGEALEVPDPYFGGPRGFEEVHDMVERACRGLLREIREAHSL